MSTIYTFNNKVLKNSANDKWLIKKETLPPIPANTMRVRTSDGNAPIKGSSTSYQTATKVTGTTDVYDVYKSGSSFANLLYGSTNVMEVLGANIIGITNLSSMFTDCTSLISITLFDTSNVTKINNAFMGCTNVQTGALALYQQMSTQTNPPTYHTDTFDSCGYNTQTGKAELKQIPSSWGGLGD